MIRVGTESQMIPGRPKVVGLAPLYNCHCEEQSDEAISRAQYLKIASGLSPRNDSFGSSYSNIGTNRTLP